MRAYVYVVVLCAAVTPARADSFVEIAGGLTTPLGDDDWENSVESSPKVALRIGAFPNEIGGYISADWTPYETDADGGFVDVSAHRFRLMGGVIFHHMVSNTLVVTGRGGIGADIARASGDVFGIEFSETDTGLALEMGVGLWFKAGKIEIGGELAIPISSHDDGDTDGVDYSYTSYDLDLLFGIRFVSY